MGGDTPPARDAPPPGGVLYRQTNSAAENQPKMQPETSQSKKNSQKCIQKQAKITCQKHAKSATHQKPSSHVNCFSLSWCPVFMMKQFGSIAMLCLSLCLCLCVCVSVCPKNQPKTSSGKFKKHAFWNFSAARATSRWGGTPPPLETLPPPAVFYIVKQTVQPKTNQKCSQKLANQKKTAKNAFKNKPKLHAKNTPKVQHTKNHPVT